MLVALLRPLSVACLVAFLLAPQDEAAAQSWQRSRMEQGYYSAMITAGSGAKLRINCMPAADSDAMSIESLTYTPRGAIREASGLAATIGVDGNTKPFTMEAKRNDGPVEIWFETGDLDTIEALGDLVVLMRKGRSLTIAVVGHRDTFALAGVGTALGKCQ